jgi:hypothetical protein
MKTKDLADYRGKDGRLDAAALVQKAQILSHANFCQSRPAQSPRYHCNLPRAALLGTTSAELARILKSEMKKWPNGNEVVVVVTKGSLNTMQVVTSLQSV